MSILKYISSTFIACYFYMIFHCNHDIVIVQILLYFLYVFCIIEHIVGTKDFYTL
jgi:hypothetical protein